MSNNDPGIRVQLVLIFCRFDGERAAGIFRDKHKRVGDDPALVEERVLRGTRGIGDQQRKYQDCALLEYRTEIVAGGKGPHHVRADWLYTVMVLPRITWNQTPEDERGERDDNHDPRHSPRGEE